MIITYGIYMIATYAPSLLALLPPISGPAVSGGLEAAIQMQMAIARVVSCGA